MPRKKTSPETDLLIAAERILDLATTITTARRPHMAVRRVDTAATRTIVAGAVGEMVAALDAQFTAVLAVGAEVGVLDPAGIST